MAKAKHIGSYVVLPRYCCLKWTVALAVCLACAYMVWPSDPELKIERLTVKRVKLHPLPPIGADVMMSVTVRVRNRAVYWLELREVDVGIRYRGKKLGHVESEGWHVRGWGFSHVDGDLEFSGLPASEVAHLLEDLAKGRVYFHTVTEVTGQLGFFLFHFPLTFKVILSCEILINTKNRSIVSQHCLHKD
ncbi:uncharacterized protein LOC113857140 [Abrus precatorius]|uniref:Uncharacterized protein LOC113857140 n=1 Tax=Abrus precatorius TaxID=3816 RepID=A0A8B8KPR6_ABRPR|nr:uncharacterized protein LOC113857140 [Abrus precatorius]